MKPTLIFDYDGTIHNTIVIYESAFRQCYDWLVREGYAKKREIPREQIAGWLGMNSREMWSSFMPELLTEIREEAGRRVGGAMVEQMRWQILWRNCRIKSESSLFKEGEEYADSIKRTTEGRGAVR